MTIETKKRRSPRKRNRSPETSKEEPIEGKVEKKEITDSSPGKKRKKSRVTIDINDYDHILTDIEGTTTPISFVKDILFPFVLKNISEFYDVNFENEEFKRMLEALKEQSVKDNDNDVEGVVVIENVNEKDEIIANIEWQMSKDRKIKALKDIQGFMWKSGYESGELKGIVHDDVIEALKYWKGKGKLHSIYSSGSVKAQKLLFGHSNHGNLLDYFASYFDTNTGSKLEAESYRKIAKELKVEANRILFLSDNAKELQSANEAGMLVVGLNRDERDETAEWIWIDSFVELIQQ